MWIGGCWEGKGGGGGGGEGGICKLVRPTIQLLEIGNDFVNKKCEFNLAFLVR